MYLIYKSSTKDKLYEVNAHNIKYLPHMQKLHQKKKFSIYRNPSVYKQLVYEFLLIQDAKINTCFSIYEPIFAFTSPFLLQTDRCSWHLFLGSNGKLIFVLRVFALRTALEERIKLVNWGIPVFSKSSAVTPSF
jgi:hypothetical protein